MTTPTTEAGSTIAADFALQQATFPTYVPPFGPHELVLAELIARVAPHFRWHETPLNPTALRSVLEDMLRARDAALTCAQRSEMVIVTKDRFITELQAANSRLHENVTRLQTALRSTIDGLEQQAYIFDHYAKEHRAKDIKGAELAKTIQKAERNEGYAANARQQADMLRAQL